MLRSQRGTSLIETTWALLLAVVILFAATSFIANSYRGTTHNRDKTFAVQKAIAILEELKGIVERKSGGNINLLDGYDDGANQQPILTVQSGITDPDHPTSGNYASPGGWHFLRQVTVQKIPSLQTNDIRLVNVKVWAREQTGKLALLAEVAGMIRTIADQFPPTQVYDVYCIANAQVPGWWVYMANLVPFVQNAISDLQGRNPGLEFRTHWIRNLAYGRDPFYTPYINDANASTSDIDWVYFYPGKMPTGSAVSYYYVPTTFKGRIKVDSTLENDYDSTSNPAPYSIADQYNNALRHPDEVALHERRVAAGLESEPTFRLLLDDMILNPGNYTNAILINLHGELMPFPPVRNYSDAAKIPDDFPGVRVVTHPEKLRYANTESVKLRVYSYHFTPTSSSDTILDEPITVLLEGVSSTAAISVLAVTGGVDHDGNGTAEAYAEEPLTANAGTVLPNGMHFEKADATVGTLVRTKLTFYNSPLRHGCAPGGGTTCSTTGGLPDGKRLYGMEYVPTPLPAPTSGTTSDAFGRNLKDTGDRTKNTARWIITIPAAAMTDNARWAYETRIGDDLTTGTVWPAASRNEPYNVSRTYVWRGDDTWIFGDGTATNPPHLPMTERFQFLGDMRHLPYKDLKDAYNSSTNRLGHGYNNYWSTLNNTTNTTGTDWWSGYSDLANGWNTGSGVVAFNPHRAFQTLREALLDTNALWTTMTGFSYFYMGLGNEIGYDADNGFSNSIPVSTKPFTGASGSMYENSITTGTRLVQGQDAGAQAWWSMTWIGEIFPDADYGDWEAVGNLRTGTGNSRYLRVARNSIATRVPTGTSLFNSLSRTNEEGSTAFFWAGTANSTFHHTYANGGTGTLQTAGQDIAANYHFPVPTTAAISRPFGATIDNTGYNPPNFLSGSHYYDGTLALANQAVYFSSSAGAGQAGSQLLRLDGTRTGDLAYVVVNGLDRTVANGSAFIGRWSFLTLIHSFLEGGLYTGDERIVQVPRIQITEPNDLTDLSDPTSIAVEWGQAWRRWDGQKYTNAYTETFSESGTVRYVVLYSADSGSTWRYAADQALAEPGVRPPSAYLSTDTTFTWTTPTANYPPGSYIVMVEAYRDGRALHYSYHKQKIYIKR